MLDHRLLWIAASLSLSVILSGCAGSSDRYPSLAIRDVERIQGQFEPMQTDAELLRPAPAPEGQAAILKSLVGQANDAHRAFLAAAPRARDLIAQIGAVGPESNSWAEAQVALADLDSHRSLAAIALGDLDLLYSGASTEFVERTEIDAARDNVLTWIAEEDAILADLRARADR